MCATHMFYSLFSICGGGYYWLPTDIYHFLSCATRLLLAYPSVTTLMLLVLANPTVTTLVVVIVRPSSCF